MNGVANHLLACSYAHLDFRPLRSIHGNPKVLPRQLSQVGYRHASRLTLVRLCTSHQRTRPDIRKSIRSQLACRCLWSSVC